VIGKYRVLFNVHEAAREIAILLVGEKRGDALIVQGERFTAHHEDRSTERSEGSTEPLRQGL
jgi:hypothetical protein